MKWLFLIGLFWHSLACAIPEAERGSQSNFLVISDIHLNIHTQHAMEFAPTTATVHNDLDRVTFEQLVRKIKTSIQSGEIPKPEFILLLGDLVGHIRFSQEDVVNAESRVLMSLQSAFPETPVLYTFGNNDSLAGDYGVFRVDKPILDAHSPLDVIKTIWPRGHFLSTGARCDRDHIYPCLLEKKTSSGYYAAYLKPNLRLIALNSVMFSKQRQGYSSDSVSEQLLWLDRQLVEVEAAQESALLVMHIPPGDHIYKAYFWSNTAFWSNGYSQQFVDIIQAHHRCLIGILTAHTHKDEIKIIENAGHMPLVGVYLNGALSTSHGNAPSIRSYVLSQSQDKLRWDLSDYWTYYFTQANNGDIQVQPLYQFKNIYCDGQANKRMSDCLDSVNISKLSRYLSVGNQNFNARISAPENIYIHG